jgi:hypothetical protein
MFCYFDGQPLPGRGSRGPLQAGTAPFKVPFVFPSGLSCANFNQFAMGCQKNWQEARDYLREGHWARFMQAIGRHDLVKIAQQAQAEEDADQGLDQFLAKVPAEVLQAPKLGVEPMQINLGQLQPGTDHAFDVTITNLGMRLLRGSARVHCDWLTIGDGPGTRELFFQTPVETQIRLRIVGKFFRAEAKAKAKAGSLSIETNGGEELVVVNAEAPVVPFPEGVLAGATTPRDIAVRAKQQPKLAAPLFESGAVEEWYKNNAWEYPVQGPAGTGLGAIQQFFEALGLAKAPVVTVAPMQYRLAAAPGDSVRFDIKVQSAEQKPVFAHAQSNQPWLKASAPIFAGNRVTIPISIPDVPESEEATLRGLLTVRANGSQRFLVPVLLDVRRATVLEATKGDRPKTAPPKSPALPIPSRRASDGAFGMGRMVYWSGLLGGWSAFVGWLSAEMGFGQRIGESTWMAMLMIVAVGTAIGGGLSLLTGLVARQWQIGKFAVGLVGGAAAGVVGALLGSGLYAVLGENGGRVVGWTLMGLAIGGWDGLFWRDNIKLRNGLVGGGLGGLLGGLLFNSMSSVLGTAMSSRSLGFVVLGLCIGLLIGLVQVLLKDGWLTVIEGFRPGRQLILSQQLTTMGTSEKSSLIFIAFGAKGVEPIHATIEWTPPGTFVVSDRQSRTGTLLNGEPIEGPQNLRDGDIIQLGVNKVRFNERVRTGAAARVRPLDSHGRDDRK